MHRHVTIRIVTVCLLLCCARTPAEEAPSQAGAGTSKRFIGCPVYRDTDAGRKSGCWLTTDLADGIQYDVTQGRVKPILGRRILVEGVVTATDRELCGARVLEPVSVSVLAEECPRYLIPAEGYPGRRFVLPARVMQPTSVPRTLPPPPYPSRTFTIEFELNSDFLVYQYAELILEDAALYIKASKPQRVTITGYAATQATQVSGQVIRETPELAEARARMVAEALERLGIARSTLELEWREAPADGFPAAAGLIEAGKRRATISATP